MFRQNIYKAFSGASSFGRNVPGQRPMSLVSHLVQLVQSDRLSISWDTRPKSRCHYVRRESELSSRWDELMWSRIRCTHQNRIERGWQMERVLTCCVRLSMPLKTSPKDPLPIRSCLVNMSSGSTFCKNKRSVRKQVRHILIWKGYAKGVTHSRRVRVVKGHRRQVHGLGNKLCTALIRVLHYAHYIHTKVLHILSRTANQSMCLADTTVTSLTAQPSQFRADKAIISPSRARVCYLSIWASC